MGNALPAGLDEAGLAALLARISERLNLLAAQWLPAGERIADPAGLERELRRDSLSGAAVLAGRWPVDAAGRRGELSINEDGSFFAEYDLLIWRETRFIEAVCAWGTGERQRGEVRVLQLPE